MKLYLQIRLFLFHFWRFWEIQQRSLNKKRGQRFHNAIPFKRHLQSHEVLTKHQKPFGFQFNKPFQRLCEMYDNMICDMIQFMYQIWTIVLLHQKVFFLSLLLRDKHNRLARGSRSQLLQPTGPVADLGRGKGGHFPPKKILAPPNLFKLKYFVCLYESLLTNFVIFCTIST